MSSLFPASCENQIFLPTLLISAVDDPFLPANVLDAVAGIAKTNEALTVEFSPHGGHVGFVSGALPWRPFYYAEWRVAEFFAEHFERSGRGSGARRSPEQHSFIVNTGDGYD